MTSHTRRVLELGVGLGLALTLVLTALADWHQRTAARVRADTIRLHVLANSDTWDDQLLKLQVRDAVLAAIPEAVTRAETRSRPRRRCKPLCPRCKTPRTMPCTAPTVPSPPACGWSGLPLLPGITAALPCPAGSTPPCALNWALPGAATGSASSTRLSASPAHSLTTPRKRKTRWCLEGMRCDGR